MYHLVILDIMLPAKNSYEVLMEIRKKSCSCFDADGKGQVFTKRQIYQAVWKDEYAFDDNNIMVHIRRLRKKIEDDPNTPKYIVTVWGVGYKLGGDI